MVDYLEYLNVPAMAILIIVIVLLIMQVVGELCEFFGKSVPEIMKIRKYFQRKKQERETMKRAVKTIEKFEVLLEDFNSHYSSDNIEKRNAWIDSVNKRLDNNDDMYRELVKKLDKNSADTLDILIDNKRNTILQFAATVIDDDVQVTHEQFRQIFSLYDKYEKVLAANNMTNGEADIAYQIIKESYENRLRNHSFVEDIRGYCK